MEQMIRSQKYILVIERDQEFQTKLATAFLRSGYHVLVVDRADEAAEIMSNTDNSPGPFDLVIIDASNRTHLDFVDRLQRINSTVPVFMITDDADKLLIIDLLNQKQINFIEHYIESHTKARQSTRSR
ncbi:MAG: hypothetical protein HQL09_07600 [Nitrospirae bacterium]|nr:hypothetical protein [Nitrospirota bacterium]